ncbi:REP-associated tyrosine transposase [Algisphaera agarilytica]|uniref:Putative transposase n=1 Tax=Algisphaera agarilytica TaxID=1385975 RepID=A0A7X0H6N7_9BACT|nr:transposase [Algisphaera agarilytica]MBB6428769.1 putative transposase [Algisphaera agarilytica]
MPNFRRNFVEGGTFFFTVVTGRRLPIFADPGAVDLLRDAIRETKECLPFEIVASAILPDHLHMIWALPTGDSRFDRRWSSIKRNFTERWLSRNAVENEISVSRQRERRRGVWQPRYIEHTLRDEADLENHVGYIHFNPVKHGYVKQPIDWPYSSLHRYVERGWLTPDWGCGLNDPDQIQQNIDIDLLDP